MPTITITTPELAPPARRAVTVRLTRWLTARGVTPSHVVIRFVTEPPGSLYAGAMPVEALPAAPDDRSIHHAGVVCQIGAERDEAFRDALAAEIGDALRVGAGTAFFHLDMRPAARSHVYVAVDGRLRRADRLGAAEETKEPAA
ncbi:hypothetical protein OQI_15285 [Streptomyces pharetrae CZA14]|uniref:4-oxalocrotonate tautomerase n=1 Tax=Streptomyces pharetrae CZA14 TaxID=1144883 RepID=A0ABX3YKA9_9ACTN|nr:hypothetical protein OQI_15285 [Streptomyces pharetrae CZA14]